MNILAVDVGTTALKFGIYRPDLTVMRTTSRSYAIHLYDHGKADISPEKWWTAFVECCEENSDLLPSIGVISLSVTTPGLVPLAQDGRALGPAILFLDGRSNQQAKDIRKIVGEEKFLKETCNLPVSGGSSLASILWIKENQPDVWARTAKFGHCNTYMLRQLTGMWAIDPSTVSITGLYNTRANDLTWNADVLRVAGIAESQLPKLYPSDAVVGKVIPEVAREIGLSEECVVLCGGNDAVLACLSGGISSPGEISNINGTCEITAVCMDHPLGSRNFNVRTHVLPNRWLSFFVLNTGGKAIEWFKSVFCTEMSDEAYYEDYIPSVIDSFFEDGRADDNERDLPEFEPYLQGSRYSTEQLTARYSRISLETTREKFLMSLLRSNAKYHGDHLEELGALVSLQHKVFLTGGGAAIRGLDKVKQRWTAPYEYEYQEQSSLRGAAMLGQAYALNIPLVELVQKPVPAQRTESHES